MPQTTIIVNWLDLIIKCPFAGHGALHSETNYLSGRECRDSLAVGCSALTSCSAPLLSVCGSGPLLHVCGSPPRVWAGSLFCVLCRLLLVISIPSNGCRAVNRALLSWYLARPSKGLQNEGFYFYCCCCCYS